MGPRSAEHSQKGASAHRGAPKWLEFVLLLVVLGIVAWLVLPVFTHAGSSSLAGIGDSNATLAIGLKGAPQSLDVRSADDPAADRILLGNVYEGLTGRTNDNKVAPALASGWTVSNGGTTYTFTLRNAGDWDGDEVVQLYVRDRYASRVRPVKELAGFARVPLKAGEAVRVTFMLRADQLAFLDEHMNWKVEAGDFDIEIGASSEDIRLTGSYRVKETAVVDGRTRGFRAGARSGEASEQC